MEPQLARRSIGARVAQTPLNGDGQRVSPERLARKRSCIAGEKKK